MAKKVLVGIRHRLTLGRLADETLAVVGEGDDRRRRARAFRVLDDLGARPFHDGHAGIGRAEVDADNFGHIVVPFAFESPEPRSGPFVTPRTAARHEPAARS